MTAKSLRLAVFSAEAELALGACSRGGGGDGHSAAPPLPPTEPPAVSAADVLARADALLFSSHRSHYSLSGGDAKLNEVFVEPMACKGARCVAGDGTAVTVADLATPSEVEVVGSQTAPGSRVGFDSVTMRYGFEVTERDPGVSATANPSMLSYGFWGAHGFAALETGSGELTGTVNGTAVAGRITQARAYAVDDVLGSNPVGLGSAVWKGIAEASPTGARAAH